MSEIDTDYLWLSQKQRRTQPLRRPLILLLCLSLVAGFVWLLLPSASSTTAISTDNSITHKTSTDKAPEVVIKKQHDSTLQTALRIEPGKLLTPTKNLVYNRRQSGQSTQSASDTTASGWQSITIRKGDTLSTAFSRKNLAYDDALAIAHLPEYGSYFAEYLRAGDTIKVKANAQGHVLGVKYPIDRLRTVSVQATDTGYDAKISRPRLKPRVAYASGIVTDSLYTDALSSDLSNSQVMKLVNIFKWTVDFAYDIHSGDRFTVVYNELYLDGRKVDNGHILAASIKTDSGVYRAFRFTGHDDEATYYQRDGTAMKRAFIRTPVNYTRISSSFSLARDHPVLDTVRAHEGTDYAAPMGTPIHAASDGIIAFRGRNGGYGNMIKLDHGNGITTRYGHMSRFVSGQHVGSHVEQGEVIGYVGSTGLSTGPHLHYEFRVNGEPKNPQTVDLPGAQPLPAKYMDEFKAHIKPLLAQLKSASQILLARNEGPAIIQ